MNWQLNTGWKYPFAKTQEQWDAMTDRAEVKIGTTGTLRCVVIEMSGISPGEVTVRVEDSSYDGCLVSVPPTLIRQNTMTDRAAIIEDDLEPGQLRPCPFCGGEAHRCEAEGGSCIECSRCKASSPLHYGRKENLDSSWNDRALAAVPPAPPSSDRTEEVIALRAALRNMADAYVRKIKTNLTPDEIAKEPWRCAEYIEAERLCRTPFKLLFTKEWLIEKIKNDPDLPCEAGAPAPPSSDAIAPMSAEDAARKWYDAHPHKQTFQYLAGLFEEFASNANRRLVLMVNGQNDLAAMGIDGRKAMKDVAVDFAKKNTELTAQLRTANDKIAELERATPPSIPEREKVLEALRPFASISFSVDGYSFDMADIIFEGRILATVKTCDDHARFSKAVDKAQSAIAALEGK